MNNIKNSNEVLKYFPIQISNKINTKIIEYGTCFNRLEEIRIRNNKPIILKFNKEEIVLENCIVIAEEINQIIQKLCNNSIYSYQNEIINGFITIKGGHRIGITGEVVSDKDKIVNIKYISSLNFRLAHNVIDCSNSLLRYVLDIENNQIYNTLIVSSPGAGKTTILKDLIRKLSNGIPEINFKGQTISVIDERGELSAMYEGVMQNDLGIRTDVIQNISKPVGIKLSIRSMAPQIIAADEIGGIGDCRSN